MNTYGYNLENPINLIDIFGLNGFRPQQGYDPNNVMGGFDEYGNSLVYNPKYYDPNKAAMVLIIGVSAAASVAVGPEMCSAVVSAAPALGRAALLGGSLLTHDPADTEIVFSPISDVVDQIETFDSISEGIQMESEAQSLNPTTILPTK